MKRSFAYNTRKRAMAFMLCALFSIASVLINGIYEMPAYAIDEIEVKDSAEEKITEQNPEIGDPGDLAVVDEEAKIEDYVTDDEDEVVKDPQVVLEEKIKSYEIRSKKAAMRAASANVSYEISSAGVLTIKGSGAMSDYSSDSPAPWYNSRSSITSIVINSGITSIGKLAFQDMYNVKMVSIPGTVTSIGEAAFYDCSALSSITIPSSAKTINDAAFYGCSGLSTLDIPNGVTTLGSYIVNESGVKTINIPASVTNLGDLTFIISSLTTINVNSGNTKYKSIDGVLYSKDGKTLIAYPTKKEAASFTVPSSVSTIGANAFTQVSNLKSVNLSNVSKIDDWAFSGSGLTSVTIPDSVTKMGYGIMSECYGLTSIKFGTGVKELPYRTCYECSSLKNIDFGGVTSIDQASFVGIGAEALVLPATLEELGAACFGNSHNLKSITSYGLVHVAYQSFFGCYALTTVNLNEGIKTIYGQAFYGCSSLKSAKIPKSCTWVHENAFPESVTLNNLNTNMIGYGANGYLDTLTINGTKRYAYAYKVLELVNKERSNKGLGTLKMDKALLEDAMLRAAEIVVLFSHQRPSNQGVVGSYSWFSYTPGLNTVMGENIAHGYGDPASVMKGWMNSQGHKENILTADWKNIGVGCFEYKGRLYWVQTFSTTTKNTNFSKPSDTAATMPIHIEENKFNDSTQDYKEVVFSFKIAGSASVAVGDTIDLNLDLNNVRFNANSVKWKSSDSSIATVNGRGKLTGIKQGSVTITAYSRGYKRASKKIDVITIDKAASKITEKTIIRKTNDKDIKGSSFSLLRPKVSNSTKKANTIKWSKVKGADGYVMYGNKCNAGGKKYKFKKLKTLGAGKTKWVHKKLKKGTYYKYIVVAYKIRNGKKVSMSVSPVLHACTKGGKYTVAKSVKVSRVGAKKTTRITLKKNKTAKIKAKEVKALASLKLSKHRRLCYESSNKKVATVSKKGVIKAKGKGSCRIYVYAQNGISKTINITVK